jgi:arylsulfatase A-like enzyme
LCVQCSTGDRKAFGQQNKKPNVLFIICDDLNDSMEGMGGHPQAKTPNLSRLAGEGIRFSNAHSAAPICGPSRASLWTGIYPHHSGLYGHSQNQNRWHNNPVLKNCKPLFEHFADNGYPIFGAGKLFHDNHNTEPLFNRSDSLGTFGNGQEYGPFAYSGDMSKGISKALRAHPDVPEQFGITGFNSFASIGNVPEIMPDKENGIDGHKGWVLIPGFNPTPFRYTSEKDRDPLPDEVTANFGIDVLQQDHDEPFLITLGIIRPHAPWHAPQPYFDMFPLDEVRLPPYLENDLDDCAEELWKMAKDDGKVARNFGRLLSYGMYRFKALQDSYEGDEGWRRWLQAYLACVAFADAQVGRVLDALEQSKYAKNTIVIVTSDHGFHMGEKDQIFKRSVWEESTRVPMIIRMPDGRNKGQECLHPVGLIDLYPTLVDLCGLTEHTYQEGGRPLDGHSLRPFLEDPEKGTWNGPDVALSVIEAGIPVELNVPAKVADQHFSVRSRDWRYTLTRKGDEELYDHRTDPHEWNNLADDPANSTVKEKLKESLLRMTGKAN